MQLTTQPRKGLYKAGTELLHSQALEQCKMTPPVEQEPSIEYPLSEAWGQPGTLGYALGVVE